jgi:hypothetical protein
MSNVELKILYEIEFGSVVFHVEISPDDKMTALCFNDSRLLIIDTLKGTILETILFDERPTASSFSQDGSFLYVVLDSGLVVEIVTDRWVESGRVKWDSSGTHITIAAGEDRRHVYAALRGRFDRIDFEKGEVTNSFSFSGWEGFALSNNKTAYLTDSEGLIALDLNSWEASYVLKSEYLDYNRIIIFDSARSRVYVSKYAGNVYVVDLIAREIIFELDRHVTITGFCVNSTGLLAFVVDDYVTVYSVGDEVKRLFHEYLDTRNHKLAVTSNDKYVCVGGARYFKVFELL